ncbi:unnamed protein product [Oppiella nova]|uniref:Thyroglobulin type-1 domain-containing protein n=1 Tax=Oppiella nova TaxID=334625 RepID=A0A7R9QQA3_9ACAR|nr:unnamed protein product [Oppiella nova]CAG2171091.1 unnamed protein product [Oppiella nova]
MGVAQHENQDCQVGNLLFRCRNGLECDASTRQCHVPKGSDPAKLPKCLTEYHNRELVANDKIILNPVKSTYQIAITKPGTINLNNVAKIIDQAKSKQVNTKESDTNYLSACEKLVLGPESYALEFKKRGYDPKNMRKVACSADGKYATKQCDRAICQCVNPTDAKPLGNSRIDKLQLNGRDMTCRCALQNYLTQYELQSYRELSCDQLGNYDAYQCFDEGKRCFCVDEHGAPITNDGTMSCLDQFIKEYTDANLNPDQICLMLRKTLTDLPMTKDKD